MSFEKHDGRWSRGMTLGMYRGTRVRFSVDDQPFRAQIFIYLLIEKIYKVIK